MTIVMPAAPTLTLTLAQDTARASSSILWWLGVILAAVVVILIVAILVRRRYVVAEQNAVQPGASGFTLSDLRELHRQGQLSDAEFEVAKKGMIARSRAMIDAPEDELPAVGAIGEDLAARGTDGIDLTTDAAKHGLAEADEVADEGDPTDRR